jgi:hypothetical protein
MMENYFLIPEIISVLLKKRIGIDDFIRLYSVFGVRYSCRCDVQNLLA